MGNEVFIGGGNMAALNIRIIDYNRLGKHLMKII